MRGRVGLMTEGVGGTVYKGEAEISHFLLQVVLFENQKSKQYCQNSCIQNYSIQ